MSGPSNLKKIFVWLFLLSALAFAHSKVVVDVKLTALFNEAGFAGVKNHWVYDENSSKEFLLENFGVESIAFNAKTSEAAFDEILGKARERNYYCYVLKGAEFLPASGISDFKIAYESKKIIIDFVVNFSIPVQDDYTMIVVVISDQTEALMMNVDMDKVDALFPKSIEVEYFYDFVRGLTMMKAFAPETEGLFLRYRNALK